MKDKIALVVNTLSGGGAEKTAANLSRVLSEKYEIDIIVNDDFQLDYSYIGHVFSLHMPQKKNRMSFSYQTKALIRRTRVLKILKAKRHYKAVISFSEMTNLANVLSGGKAIISVHNSVSKSKANGWKHRLVARIVLPYCVKKAYKTVPCSKEISDELIRDYRLSKEKSFVIYNGIDCQNVKDLASEKLPQLISENSKKLIVTVGRLTWEKGQWHLIRVVRKLLDEGMDIKLIILGEGPLRRLLEELVSKSGLEEKVLLPGFVENPYQYMAAADVVVFPSLTEGFSNAILEALACSAPVISTDHETGAREILAPDTDYHFKIHNTIDEAQYGVLVPVCDGTIYKASEPLTNEEKLLGKAIRRMVTDPGWNTRYRNAALKRAEQLSIHSVAKKWIEAIEN